MNWSPGDLEEPDACFVCGRPPGAPLHPPLADPLRPGSPRRWRLLGCDACGSAILSPRPTPASIGRAYRDYFTHGPPPSPEPPARGLPVSVHGRGVRPPSR